MFLSENPYNSLNFVHGFKRLVISSSVVFQLSFQAFPCGCFLTLWHARVVLSVPCIEKDYGDLRDVYMWLWKTAAKKPGILNACRIVTFPLISVCNHQISLQLMFVRWQIFAFLSTGGTSGAKY